MSLDLVQPGSLEKPGPIGRIVRLMLGIFCLYGLVETIRVSPYFAADPISLLPGMSLMILVTAYIFNYVVNIGFSRNWHRLPTISSCAAFAILALISYLIAGKISTPIVGIPVLLWLGYFFAHLGLSFVLAAIQATPGCEMRAIPQLFGTVTGRETMEHHCPSSIISAIDDWEKNRSDRTS